MLRTLLASFAVCAMCSAQELPRTGGTPGTDVSAADRSDVYVWATAGLGLGQAVFEESADVYAVVVGGVQALRGSALVTFDAEVIPLVIDDLSTDFYRTPVRCRDRVTREIVDDLKCSRREALRVAAALDASYARRQWSVGVGYRVLSAPGPYAVAGFAQRGLGDLGPQWRISWGPRVLLVGVRATL